MKSMLKQVRSMWLVALLALFSFAVAASAFGIAASAFAYDGLTQPTIAYDAPSRSPINYDPMSVFFSYEKGNRTPRIGAAFIGFSESLAAEETATTGTTALREGSFSITDWSGYPAGVPKPTGPFRLVEGAEYDTARAAANQANNNIRLQQGLR
jgi:hypothetical protein